MPIYTIKRKSTGETWEDTMTISAMEKMLADDKDLDVIPSAVLLGDIYRLGMKKPDNHSQFRDVINHIRKNNPKSTIDGSWV